MEEDSVIKFFIKCAREDNSKNFSVAASKYIQDHSIDWRGMKNSYLLMAFGLLYNKIIDLPKIPKETKTELWLQYIINRARNIRINNLTLDLAKKFEPENIDIIFLKGAALLLTIYRKDITERPMGDIDALVKTDDLEKAAVILTKNGFKRCFKSLDKERFHYAYTKDDVLLELHWVIDPDVASEDIFKSFKVIKTKNTAVKILNAEYTIIIACLNFIRDSLNKSEHLWPRTKKLKDSLYFSPFFFLLEIKKIFEYYRDEIDWPKFFQLINSYSEEYKIIASIWTVNRIFELKLPLNGIKIKNIYARIFIRLSKMINQDDLIKHILLMRNIDRLYEGVKLFKNPLLLIKKIPKIFKRIMQQ